MILLHFLFTIILAAFIVGAVGRLVSALDAAAAAALDNCHAEDRARRFVWLAWAWVVLFAAALVGWLVYLVRWA